MGMNTRGDLIFAHRLDQHDIGTLPPTELEKGDVPTLKVGGIAEAFGVE